MCAILKRIFSLIDARCIRCFDAVCDEGVCRVAWMLQYCTCFAVTSWRLSHGVYMVFLSCIEIYACNTIVFKWC